MLEKSWPCLPVFRMNVTPFTGACQGSSRLCHLLTLSCLQYWRGASRQCFSRYGIHLRLCASALQLQAGASAATTPLRRNLFEVCQTTSRAAPTVLQNLKMLLCKPHSTGWLGARFYGACLSQQSLVHMHQAWRTRPSGQPPEGAQPSALPLMPKPSIRDRQTLPCGSRLCQVWQHGQQRIVCVSTLPGFSIRSNANQAH